MDYNKIYSKRTNVFGSDPSLIVKKAAKYYLANHKAGSYLDIGAGQGRDSLFMANLGFSTTSIDSSIDACKQLADTAITMSINNLKVKHSDILSFAFKDNSFDIISAINVLHFINHPKAIEVLQKIKKSLTNGGVAIVSLIMLENGFQKNELLEHFSDFDIIYYSESVKDELGHPGQPEPHKHHMSYIIARKI